MNIWSYIGLIVVFYIGFRFIKSLGNGLPIIEMLLLIAGLQWVVGAAIEYSTDFQHYKYYMYVDESTYMSYVVPAYILLAFFMLWRTAKLDVSVASLSKYSKYGIYLFVIGFFAEFAKSVAPTSLLFVFFLLANLKFIGAIILFFSEKKIHQYFFYFTIGYLVVSAIRSGFFHDLILLGSFFFMFWSLKYKPTLKLKIIILVTGFALSTVIQVVKSEYRDLIWNGYQGNYASLFLQVLTKRLSGGITEDTEQQSELNVRLNQGWIISAIIEHTPRVQSHANGKTIKEAVFASALPRFLNPDKKIAGGVENFEKYTGIQLEKNTSMGMSLVGEAYANFGIMGMWFLGLWGFLLSRFWNFLIDRSKKNIVILFFLPLIFLQVVKAETELVVVLNHLVKATVLVLGILYLSKNFLNKTLANG
jgi:hypothetical protein